MEWTRRRMLGGAGLMALGVSTLSGCAQQLNPADIDLERIAFPGGAIALSANRVDIVARPRPARGDAELIDAEFPVSIEDMARQWAEQRLRPTGAGGGARFIIDDASALSNRLEGKETIQAILQARLVMLDAAGGQEAGAGVKVISQASAEGKLNMIERERFLHSIVLDMARQLDERLTASILRNLAGYVSV